MAFSKKIAVNSVDGSRLYEDIFLSAMEEREQEQVARQEHLYLIRQCLADARNVIKDEKLMDMQSHVLSIALALFKKRASHSIEYKSELCVDKCQRSWGFPKAKSVKKKEA